MTRGVPPTGFTPAPGLTTLPAGTPLWRMHSCVRPAAAFNTRFADPNFGGGRFDGTTAHPYPFLYAGLDATTALSEALLRDLPPDERGYRRILRKKINGRRISRITVPRKLVLVSLLTEEDLSAVAQSQWLITAQTLDYHLTRRWAAWLREKTPEADGLIWPSLRQRDRHSVVLFGDRCPTLESLPGQDRCLGTGDGARWLNQRLLPYRAQVRMPPGRPGPAQSCPELCIPIPMTGGTADGRP